MIRQFKGKVQKPGYTEEGEEKEKLNLLKKVLHSVVHFRVPRLLRIDYTPSMLLPKNKAIFHFQA